MTFKKTPHSTSLLNSARGARSRSPAPVPQEPSSNEAISAIIPASLLFPRGMLKGRDTVGYNPACLRVAVRPSSTSSPSSAFLFASPLCSPPAALRCAAPHRVASLSQCTEAGRCPAEGGRGCSHAACTPPSDGGKRMEPWGGRAPFFFFLSFFLRYCRRSESNALPPSLRWKNLKSSFWEPQDWFSATTTAQWAHLMFNSLGSFPRKSNNCHVYLNRSRKGKDNS